MIIDAFLPGIVSPPKRRAVHIVLPFDIYGIGITVIYDEFVVIINFPCKVRIRPYGKMVFSDYGDRRPADSAFEACLPAGDGREDVFACFGMRIV